MTAFSFLVKLTL